MNKSEFARARHRLVTLALVMAAPAVFADPLGWVAGDGAWENATNWSGGALPTAADFVDIAYLGSVTANATGNVAKELTSASALSVKAGKLTVVGTVETFGALAVEAGAALDAGRIKIANGGALLVDGTGAAVNVVEGVFNRGNWAMSGASTLNAESFDNFLTLSLASGATATANSMINHAAASATLSGAGSALVIHGDLTNDGDMQVENAALLDTHSIDNNATLTLTQGRLRTASQINVGSLEVSGDAARYEADDVVTNHGNITVSAAATASIKTLANHAAVKVDGGQLSGQNFKNDLDGALTLTNGATVSFDSAISASRFGISIDGVDARLETGTFQQLSGTTFVNGGTLAASSGFGVQIVGGELRGHGDIDGKLVLNDDGVLAPGDSGDATQRLTVAAGLALLGGRFDVELGGTAATDHDALNVTGAASLGGTLRVALLSGYVPVLGDAFDIILADSISGAFGNILLPSLGDGLKFTTINGGTFYRLEVAAVPLPAPALLLGGALGVLGLAGRRRRRHGV